MDANDATLAIHDPPYILVAFERRSMDAFIARCESSIAATHGYLSDHATLYVWLGADQKRH